MKKSTKVRKTEVETPSRKDVASIGIDLSDRSGKYCALGSGGTMIETGKVKLTKEAVIQWAQQFPPTLIAIEAGTHSAWVSRALGSCGHEVVVANPVKVALISKNNKKTDGGDAELLARLVLFDRTLLFEIHHRGEEAQRDLQLIRSREIAVASRSKLVTHIRGVVKSFGARLPKCSTEAFAKTRGEVPLPIAATIEPLYKLIEELSATIAIYDRKVNELIEKSYPEAKHLMKIRGVGPLTGLAYVLVLEDAKKFKSSRSVGAYLGFTPKSDQSGEEDPDLGITKAGDRLLRTLMVQAAHYILGPHGEDCDLRRHGEKIASRGGKNAKKRAAIAVARKLAVLMHMLWVTGKNYDPLYNAKQRSREEAKEGNAEASPGVKVLPTRATARSTSSASLRP